MGSFSSWILHEDQKEWFEYLFAVVLNTVFLAVAALVLWPLERLALAWDLTQGYWIFWGVLILTGGLLVLGRRIFRVNIDDHFDAYLISALFVSGVVQLGWSAFAAVTIDAHAASASGWVVALLYAIGFVSCWVAYVGVSSLYMGSLYRLVNLVVALVGFVVFSVWPGGGRAIFGWFS